jgi:hypothetical protein
MRIGNHLPSEDGRNDKDLKPCWPLISYLPLPDAILKKMRDLNECSAQAQQNLSCSKVLSKAAV